MKLNELLNAYRAELDSAKPPDLAKLFDAPPQEPRRVWWVAGAMAAAAALAMFVFWPSTPEGAPAFAPIQAKIEAEAAVVSPGEFSSEQPVMRPVAIPKARARREAAMSPATFIALAEMDMLPQPRTVQLVRVSVDESRLANLGLRPAQGQRDRKLAAEILLGEDGIARAIRILGEERE